MFKDQQSSLTGSLAADVASLFRAWWYRDRIRCSPREGKLLRLAPGAILCVAGRTIEVETRDVMEQNRGAILRYRCRDSDSRPELWVTFQAIPKIVWSCGGEEQHLAVDDIEVWSEGGRDAIH